MSEAITLHTAGNHQYDVITGTDLKDSISILCKRFDPQKAFVAVDENVYQLHEEKIKDDLGSYFDKLLIYKVPAGEGSKSKEQYFHLLDHILNNGAERGTPLFAVGGGVTGDLAGFCAASALRGIPLIQVPTTLLSMVDSSVGGKTGINHPSGKNLIGSFYQPQAVIADLSYLSTLPEEEWINGMSEVLKYGYIHSPDILFQIKQIIGRGNLTTPVAWSELIRKSVSIKAEIVELDEHEAGVRAFLNFGHTYAHVIEKIGEYGSISHGEAVFAGMFGAIFVSNKLGADIDLSNLNELKPLYDLNLSERLPDTGRLIDMMKTDKKVKQDKIRLILLEGPGKPYIKSFGESELIGESWDFIRGNF